MIDPTNAVQTVVQIVLDPNNQLVIQQAGQQLSALAAQARQVSATVASAMTSGITARAAQLVAGMNAAVAAFQNSFAQLMQRIGRSLVIGYAGFSNLMSGLGNMLQNAWRGLGNLMSAGASGFMTAMRGLGSGISTVFTSIRNSLGTALTSLATGISNLWARLRAPSPTAPVFQAQYGLSRLSNSLLIEGFNAINSAALSLARTGLRVLTAELVAMSYIAVKITKEFVAVNEKFTGLEITLRSSFKSPEVAKAIREGIVSITKNSVIPFEGLAEMTRAFAIMPQTRGQLLEQTMQGGDMADPKGFLGRMNLMVEKMLAFRPEKNVGDAIFSIREALGGEFRSLIRRFDIPMNLIAQMSGKTAKELKTDQPATLEALETLFNNIIDDQAISQSLRQPSRVIPNIAEQAFQIPMLKIGEAGVYGRIITELNSFYSQIQGVTRNRRDPTTGREIKDSSLIEKYAPQISDSLIRMLEEIKIGLTRSMESIMDSLGFGKADAPGVEMIERVMMAVNSGVSKLADTLPSIIEKLINVFTTLGKILSQITSFALSLIDFVLPKLESSPVLTSLALVGGLGAARSLPGMAVRGIDRLPVSSSRGLLGTPIGATGGAIAGAVGAAQAIIGSATLVIGTAWFGAQLGLEWGEQIKEGLVDTLDRWFPGLLGLAKGTQSTPKDATEAKALTKEGAIAQQEEIFALATSSQSSGNRGLRRDGTPGQQSYRKTIAQELEKYLHVLQEVNASGGVTGNENADSWADNYARLAAAKRAIGLLGIRKEEFLDDADFIAETIQKLNLDKPLTPPERDAERTEANLKRINEFFSGKGILNNAEEGFSGKAFSTSIGSAQVQIQSFEKLKTSSGAAEIKKLQEGLTSRVLPMNDMITKINEFIKMKEALLTSISDVDKLLNNKDGLLGGQQAVLNQFKRQLQNLLDNPVDRDKVIDIFGRTYGEVVTSTEKIIAGLMSDAEDLSDTVKNELLKMQDTKRASLLEIDLTSISGVYGEIEQFFDTANKSGHIATEAIRTFKNSIKKLEPTLFNEVEAKIDEMIEAIRNPATDKEGKNNAQILLKEGMAGISQSVEKRIADVLKKYQEIIDNMGAFELNLQTGIVGGGGTARRNKGSGSITSPFEGNATDYDLQVQDEVLMPSKYDFVSQVVTNQQRLGLSSTAPGAMAESLGEYGKTATEVVLGIGKTIGTTQKAATEKLNSEANTLRQNETETKAAGKEFDNSIQNSLQTITGIFESTETLRNGPMSRYLKTQFQENIGRFPSLGAMGAENINKLFAEVKEGDAGLDVLYDKMKVVSDMSKRLADDLEKMALSEPKGSATRERYLDEARKLRESAVGKDQKMHEMDEKSNPFTSFFKGFETYAATSQRALMDWSNAATQVANSIEKSFGTAFASFVTGSMSAKEAFQSFANSLITDLARMAAEAAAKQLLGLVINIAGTALTGNSAVGAVAAAGTTSYLTAANSGQVGASYIGDFASGGSVRGGSGMRDDVPAMLTGGEYVVNRNSAQKYGAILEAINSGTVRHYASGGSVGNPMRAAAVRSEHDQSGDTRNFNFALTVNRNSEGGGSSGGGRAGSRQQQDAADKEMARRMKAGFLKMIEEEQRLGGRFRGS